MGMNEIVQNLNCDETNGRENFCSINEKMLSALKELSKREYKETEQLKQENKKFKEVIDKAIQIYKECKMLMPHEFDWQEQFENAINILKEVE